MSRQHFFSSSKTVAQRIGELFTFIWPTAAAMWNLRWQVNGFLNAVPNASISELAARFTAGSGIRSADLRTACISTSWEAQQAQFAKIVLIELCALYEYWADTTMNELEMANKSKKLQFPGENGSALPTVVLELQRKQSQVMRKCIYPTLVRNKRYDAANLRSLLACYRFFKESRNCIIHNSSKADKKLIASYSAFASCTPAALGLKEVPAHFPVVLDQPFALSLRGVAGFGEVVLKLVATLDAELCLAKPAEKLFVKRLNEVIGHKRALPVIETKRFARVSGFVVRLGLPKPDNIRDLVEFLRDESLAL